MSYWRRDFHFTWSSELGKGLAIFSKGGTFLLIFKTLSNGTAPGNRTRDLPLCSQVFYQHNRANPATFKCSITDIISLLLLPTLSKHDTVQQESSCYFGHCTYIPTLPDTAPISQSHMGHHISPIKSSFELFCTLV